jgi:hypothetical protein
VDLAQVVAQLGRVAVARLLLVLELDHFSGGPVRSLSTRTFQNRREN